MTKILIAGDMAEESCHIHDMAEESCHIHAIVEVVTESWTTAYGVTYAISDLTDDHIENILSYFPNEEPLYYWLVKPFAAVEQEAFRRGLL